VAPDFTSGLTGQGSELCTMSSSGAFLIGNVCYIEFPWYLRTSEDGVELSSLDSCASALR
jgi:hypothetical protein